MTIGSVAQPAAGHLPDVIIKYVRCKKNPMAAWDFLYGRKILCSPTGTHFPSENEEENPLLLQR